MESNYILIQYQMIMKKIQLQDFIVKKDVSSSRINNIKEKFTFKKFKIYNR